MRIDGNNTDLMFSIKGYGKENAIAQNNEGIRGAVKEATKDNLKEPSILGSDLSISFGEEKNGKVSISFDGQKVVVMDEGVEKQQMDQVDEKKTGRVSPAECETCKKRKYQDGSNENVSYKAASHISPQSAPAAVRAHEGEHVSNAYKKARQNNGKVLSASVTIQTAVCPECGTTYVSGGETATTIRYSGEEKKKESGYYSQSNNYIKFDVP